MEAMRAGVIGYIDTPAQGNKRPPGVTWCADNGCYGKGWPGSEKWLQWLQKNAHAADTCLFATAPDVVGDAAATIQRSAPWLPKIRELGYPAALVAQNGLEPQDTPWDTFDVLFLGGSLECLPCDFIWPSDVKPKRREPCPHCGVILTEWKVTEAARRLVHQAKAHGKKVHMGRVNSEKRYRYALGIGCDTADGTYLTFGPTQNLPDVLAWTRLAGQGHLDLGAAA